MDSFEPKPPYGANLWAKRRPLISGMAALLIGVLFVYAWAVLTYLLFASGGYCPGDDPDPIFACMPTFEQHAVAWIVTNVGMLAVFALSLWGVWVLTRRWRSR